MKVSCLLLIVFLSVLFRVESQSLLHFKNYTVEDGLSSSNIYSIYQDDKGYMWFGSDIGISKFNGYEFENLLPEAIVFNEPIVKIWKEKVIIFSDTNNKCYTIIENEIVKAKIDNSRAILNHKNTILHSKIVGDFLKEKKVTASFEDRNKAIWIATLGDGIYYIPRHEYIEIIPSNEEVYNFNIINDSIIYENKKIVSLRSEQLGKSKLFREDLFYDDDKLYYKEDLIYASYGNYLNRSHRLKSRSIKKHKNFVYFIGDNNVIYKVEPAKKTHLLLKDKVLNASCIGFSLNNELWVSGRTGLYKLKGSNYVITDSIKELTNHKVISITSSKKHELVIATKNSGVFIKTRDSSFFKKENNKIKRYYVNALEVDEKDNIWIGTNSGVYKLDVNDLDNELNFNYKNGLLSNQVNDIKALKGKIYVAHNNGVSKIDINRFKKNSHSTSVIFPYLRLDNEKHASPEKRIVVSSDYSYLTINYLAINYKLREAINYKYRIQGIHDDWVLTKNRKVQFTSLPKKGIYTFEVKAQNEDGVWGGITKLEMEFLLPFYKSWWFISCVLVLIAILIWAMTKALYKRKLKMEKLQTERLAFEAKALQSQMNPHFVFNALNSIQSFITIGDTMNSEIYLAKFSVLLRKTLNYSNQKTIVLSKEIENLEAYLELEKLRFGERLNYSIFIENSVESGLIDIPPMLIQPFVENAIIHGLSPKSMGGLIKIYIYLRTENCLVCEITDDGVGRQYKVTSGHKSLGISIVKKRLSLLLKAESDYITYTDLKDKEGKAIGTKVELIIPIT